MLDTLSIGKKHKPHRIIDPAWLQRHATEEEKALLERWADRMGCRRKRRRILMQILERESGPSTP